MTVRKWISLVKATQSEVFCYGISSTLLYPFTVCKYGLPNRWPCYLSMKHVSSCPGLQGSCAFFILTRLPKPPKLSATAPQHPQLICTLSTTSSTLHPPQWVKPENKSGTMIHKRMNTILTFRTPILCSRGSPLHCSLLLLVPLVLQCPRPKISSPSKKKKETNKLGIWKRIYKYIWITLLSTWN